MIITIFLSDSSFWQGSHRKIEKIPGFPAYVGTLSQQLIESTIHVAAL